MAANTRMAGGARGGSGRRWGVRVALVVLGLLVGCIGTPARPGARAQGLESRTPGLPQLWFATTPPLIRSTRGWPANDHWRLYDPAALPEWATVARHIDVMLIALHGLRVPTDAELTSIITTLRRLNIKLALNAHMVEHDPGCGGGEGYAPNATQVAAKLQRIKRLGGTVDYISMDEPLIRGHRLRDLGGGRVGCHYAIADVARRVRRNVEAIRAVFPDIRIGSTEAINTRFTGAGPGWGDAIREWAEAFHAETGKPLAFTMVAVEPREPGWEPSLRNWIRHAERLRIPTGVIYVGAGGMSDQAWTANAIQFFTTMERTAGIHPQVVGIMSWNQWPQFNLPETRPGTLTNVVLEYLRFRGVRN